MQLARQGPPLAPPLLFAGGREEGPGGSIRSSARRENNSREAWVGGRRGDTLKRLHLRRLSLGGRTCFLGNSLHFRLLGRLAQRPNSYFSYEDLFARVWDGGVRSDDAVRSVVKRLRRALRRAGLGDLAKAIDGSVPGHYALKLGR